MGLPALPLDNEGDDHERGLIYENHNVTSQIVQSGSLMGHGDFTLASAFPRPAAKLQDSHLISY